MTRREPYRTLFLCTGNSARSILAEAILTRVGGGRFHAFSAGSRPTGIVHPLALEVLAERGFATADLRSKSWDEFEAAEGPGLDFVFTVCDRAAGETCPVWPGQPVTAHWGIDDPAAATGSPSERRAAFDSAFEQLAQRIDRLASLPIDRLDPSRLTAHLVQIGEAPAADPAN